MQRNGGRLQTVAEFRSDRQIEREADLFAAHFLAPTVLFNQLSENSEFNKSSLKKIAGELNISLMNTSFRYVSLTDLVCSLIISNNSNSKVRFEFRSKRFRELGYVPLLSSTPVPEDSMSFAVISGAEADPDDETVLLNTWYPDLRKKIRCNESVFQLGYNDTTVTLLSLIDDPEDLDED